MSSPSPSSSAKKRPKPIPSFPPSFLASSLMEPPRNLFPSKGEFLRLVAVLAIASSVAFTCNFIATYVNLTTISFCDTDSDSFPDFCEPCPKNGVCTQGKLECFEGYRKHGNICMEDGDINERAKKLSEWVENRLCEAYAQFLCYGTGTIWAEEADILNDLNGHQLMKNFQSDNATHIYMRTRAMEIIDKSLETRTNSDGNVELKCPDLVAEHYKPLSCRLYQWISNHTFVIAALCTLVVGFTVLQRRWYLAARCDELYHQVCEVLEENALTSKKSNGENESWVVASQLRDHLLLPKERKDPVLWKRVEKLVQDDSRVDQYPKLVKGESKVVWEWQVEGSWSSRKAVARTRTRTRGEASKLKSSMGLETNSDQHVLKSESFLAD